MTKNTSAEINLLESGTVREPKKYKFAVFSTFSATSENKPIRMNSL